MLSLPRCVALCLCTALATTSTGVEAFVVRRARLLPGTSLVPVVPIPPPQIHYRRSSFSTALAPIYMKGNTGSNGNNDDDFMRWAKQSRSASVNDNKVTLLRPLGLVLNQDEQGNVYVETVAPKGNAARTGKVKEGDIVTMCSATFGDDMWSCRGVGLTRVLAAIRVRSGATVSLVLESPGAYKTKKADTVKQLQAREAAVATAQKRKDELLSELERDEQKLKKGKGFFGLF